MPSLALFSTVATARTRALKRCLLLPSPMCFTTTTTKIAAPFNHLKSHQNILANDIKNINNTAPWSLYQTRSFSYEENHEKRDTDLILRSLDAPVRKPPEASPEEQERRKQIGRNYVIGCFNEHNEENHDLTCKIKMKLHAVSMLPKKSKIKEAALIISDEMPPTWRKAPTWTPPIPNFDPEMFLQKGEV